MAGMTSARNLHPRGRGGEDVIERLGGVAPEPEPIITALRDVAALSRALEGRLGAALGVNPTDLHVMEFLIGDGPLSPSEIARRLDISTAASTMAVDRLVALGHVEKRAHDTDRRRVVVVPASESVHRAVGHLMPMIQGVSAVIDDLDATERQVIERFLDRVNEVYRAAVDDLI